jgi:MoxR-like ATPase
MTDHSDLITGIEALSDKLAQARDSINRRFIGQTQVVDLTLTAMLCLMTGRNYA